jgi:hypothetical protein
MRERRPGRHLFHSCRPRRCPGGLPGELSSHCHGAGLQIKAYALAGGQRRSLRLDSSHLAHLSPWDVLPRGHESEELRNSVKPKSLRRPTSVPRRGMRHQDGGFWEGSAWGRDRRSGQCALEFAQSGGCSLGGHEKAAAWPWPLTPGRAGSRRLPRRETYLPRITRRYAATFLLCSSRSWAKR